MISDLVSAVFTSISHVADDVTWATGLEEIGHVFAAVLAAGRREALKLGRGTGNFAAMEFSDDHTADKASEGVELVQPRTPEFWDLRLGDCDTAEEGEGDDDEGVEERGDERTRCDSCYHLTESDGEELGDENHEKLVSCSGAGGLEAWHVVDWQEESHGAENRIWHFCYDQ